MRFDTNIKIKVNSSNHQIMPKRRRCVKSEDSDSEDQKILQQRNGRRKCTKTKVKNSSFRNKYDRVEAEDPEDVIVQPKNKAKRKNRIESSEDSDMPSNFIEENSNQKAKKCLRTKVKTSHFNRNQESSDDSDVASNDLEENSQKSKKWPTPKVKTSNYKRILYSPDSSDSNLDFEMLQATPSTSKGPKIKRVPKRKRVPIRKNSNKIEKLEELDKLRVELRNKRNIKSVRRISFKSESENEDGDQTKFERKTRTFTSKFPFKCDLPECEKTFVVGETHIIGVHLHNSETGLLQGKENDKNYHICASHDSLFDEEAVAQKEKSYENSDFLASDFENSMDRDFIKDDKTDEAGTESESENSQESQRANDTENNDFLASDSENSMDRDFIKDDKKDEGGTESGSDNSQENQSDNNEEASRMLGEIIKDFQRNTSQDKLNKEKYMEEHANYQFQIHKESNPGLHLSPAKRLRRNLRIAKFDQGLKDDRGIEKFDPDYYEETKEISCHGIKIKVLLNKKRKSRYEGHCALKNCGAKYSKGDKIIGAKFFKCGQFRLNDRGKPYWICYSHYANFESSDSKSDDTSDTD